MQFNLRSIAGDNRWGFGVRLRDLAGLPPRRHCRTRPTTCSSPGRARPARSASRGSFDEGRGYGSYAFTPDAAFLTSMGTAGYRTLSSRRHRPARRGRRDRRRTSAVSRRPATRRCRSTTSIRMRIHRVTPEFVRDLGGGRLQGHRDRRSRAHGDPRRDAGEHQGAPGRRHPRLSVDDLDPVPDSQGDAGVHPRARDRGYKELLPDDLVRMRIHRVTLEGDRSAKAAGFGTMAIDDLVKFRIHKVTPEFISALNIARLQEHPGARISSRCGSTRSRPRRWTS